MSSDSQSFPSPSSPVPSSVPVTHPNLSNLMRLGDSLFASSERINAELFTLTYGALIVQLVKDYQKVDMVNSELDRMGFSIGERIIEEFLSKASTAAPNFNLTLNCANFKETAFFLSKVALKMFLGISGEVTRFSADGKSFSLVIKGNPLVEFVEIPAHLKGLKYSNLICGVIRGALQQIQLSVETELIPSFGPTGTIADEEIRVTLKEILQETFAEEE